MLRQNLVSEWTLATWRGISGLIFPKFKSSESTPFYDLTGAVFFFSLLTVDEVSFPPGDGMHPSKPVNSLISSDPHSGL